MITPKNFYIKNFKTVISGQHCIYEVGLFKKKTEFCVEFCCTTQNYHDKQSLCCTKVTNIVYYYFYYYLIN